MNDCIESRVGVLFTTGLMLLACGSGSVAGQNGFEAGAGASSVGGQSCGGNAGAPSMAGAGTVAGTSGAPPTGTGGGAGSSAGAPPTAATIPLPPLVRLPASLGPRIAGGVEPGDPSLCEAAPPSRCYWVDADADAGGDGSFASPYNSFETVVGAMDGTDYVQGAIAGGDYLYVRGTFSPPTTDDPEHYYRVVLRRPSQGGTADKPTVIKSWLGSPRAVFDGQHQTSDLLVFAGLTSFRVANIEIRNANGRGLQLESVDGTATFEDLVVHDTIGDGAVGVGGGLHFFGGESQELVVRNCHFYANNRQAFGAINNIGALSLTSDLEATELGSLRVYRNVFENETTGVRHKHAGSYATEIYENLFWNSERAIVLRSFHGNDIHSNTFLSLSESAVVSYVENTKGELSAAIHHNNFFNTTSLLTDVIGAHDHNHVIDVHHNFYQSTSATTVYAVSSQASLPFLSGSDNLYLLTDDSQFFSDPVDGGFLDFAAFSSSIADANSRYHMTAAAGGDVAAFNQAYEQYAMEREANGIGY